MGFFRSPGLVKFITDRHLLEGNSSICGAGFTASRPQRFLLFWSTGNTFMKLLTRCPRLVQGHLFDEAFEPSMLGLGVDFLNLVTTKFADERPHQEPSMSSREPSQVSTRTTSSGKGRVKRSGIWWCWARFWGSVLGLQWLGLTAHAAVDAETCQLGPGL